MNQPSLLIVEPNAAGHRAVWARWITNQMSARGWKVVVATSRQALEEESFSWIGGGRGSLPVVTVDLALNEKPATGEVALLRQEMHRHRLIKRLYKQARGEHEFDVVLLPFGDYLLHAAALVGSPFGGTPWVTVVMGPTFHHKTVGVNTPPPSHLTVRRALFRRFLTARRLIGCLTIDESLYVYLQSNPKLMSKVDYLADPATPLALPSRDAARAAFGIPDDAVTLLVTGGLSARKGLRHLASALRALGRSDLHALLVGKADAATREWLRSPEVADLIGRGVLHVMDRWIDDETVAASLAAADIGWLGYERHWRSSGVLVQCAQSGLPVLACDEGVIGWLTLRHQCGLAVPITQERRVASALNRLVSSSELRRQMGDRGKRAFALHTVDNAGMVLSKMLDRALDPDNRSSQGR
jgi:glycosyltransferase involved in cell wall biosynthesis